MGLCLPRSRSATSLATRPSTLSVASITNHSCTTSAGLALKVFMSVLCREETRLSERSGSVLVVLGAAHDWQPLEPEWIRHLLGSCPGVLGLGASTPPQNGKPTSIAQSGKFA